MTARGTDDAGSARGTIALAFAVFLVVFAAYIASWQTQRTDSVFVMHSAMSLVSDGDLDIAEFGSVRRWEADFFTRVDDRIYMEYPAAVAALAAPFALAVDTVTGGRLAAELDAGAFSPLINAAEMGIASFYAALAAVFIFLISRRFLAVRYALAATFIFAFCTSAWSSASRGLWMEGPSMLLLAITLYLALLARERPGLAGFLGVPLAAAYIIRPTNAIPAAFFTLYVFLEHRRCFRRYLTGGVLTLLPFLALNLLQYGAPLAPYHVDGLSELDFGRSMLAGLAGTLVSPGRGLLIYSPVFLLGAYGLYIMIKQHRVGLLEQCLLGMVIAHWLVISAFSNWGGGYSFGPRLFTDMLPVLVFFLLPVLARLQQSGIGRNRALAIALAVLLLASFGINLRGATSSAPFAWNTRPPESGDGPSRLWDWGDPPFLRGL